MIGYDSQRPTDTPEYRCCPDCGNTVDWDTMIWLNGRCTCPSCYQRRISAERIKELEEKQ